MENINHYQNKDFRFVLNRLPTVEYFASVAEIPSIGGSPILVPNPFVPIQVPGESLDYAPYPLTFRIDEDFRNYEEILLWFQSYGAPHSFDQYKQGEPNTKKVVKSKVSDGTLILPTSKYNANIRFVFEDMFPINLSGLSLDLTDETVPVLVCTVTFSYTKFTLQRSPLPGT